VKNKQSISYLVRFNEAANDFYWLIFVAENKCIIKLLTFKIKRMKKKLYFLLAILLVIFVVIQLIPAKLPPNSSVPVSENILAQNASNEVMTILKTSCFDCHSNQTDYRWYAHIVPVSFLIARDVSKGREALNFSEWSTYNKRKLVRKLGDIKEQITKKEMPMKIYTLMHPDTKLNQAQMLLITDWADQETKKIMGQ